MRTPSYYAIIPANVRYDKDLKANEKLLYGEITCLTQANGKCFASNDYFAKLYNVSKTSISKWISNLVKKGYLKSQIVYKTGTKQIDNRYLTIVNDPIEEKLNTPIEEKLKDNSTSINNTSIIEKINKKEIEDDFLIFWKAYPKRIDKTRALKAFTKAYKEIPPLNELLEIIEKNKRSKKWSNDGGEFIPHPTTWLNGKRWEDEVNIEIRSVSSNEEIIMRAMRGQNKDYLEGEVI